MKSTNIKVSIIIPLFKGQKYINLLLDMISHLGINKQNVEIVFVNDYPDEQISINMLNNDLKVRIIVNEVNIGIHASRIKGLEIATGEYIVFLDQDDILCEQYFDTQFDAIKEKKAVFCNGYWRNGELIYSHSNEMNRQYTFDEYLESGYPLVSLGQLMIKRDAIPTEWTTNPLRYNGCDDLYLWILMMLHNVDVSVNYAPVYIHEEDGNNASLNYNQMALSIQDVRNHVMQLDMMDENLKSEFACRMDSKIAKYKAYERLKQEIGNTSKSVLEHNFLQNGIKKIAVYGVGIYGKWLINYLKDTDVEVEYAIDKRSDVKTIDVLVVDSVLNGRNIDAVVVTPIFDYEDIKTSLLTKCDYMIFSIEDFLSKEK